MRNSLSNRAKRKYFLWFSSDKRSRCSSILILDKMMVSKYLLSSEQTLAEHVIWLSVTQLFAAKEDARLLLRATTGISPLYSGKRIGFSGILERR